MYLHRVYGVRRSKKRVILIFNAFDELVAIVFNNSQAAAFMGAQSTSSVCTGLKSGKPVLGRFTLRLYNPDLDMPLDKIYELRLYEYDQLVKDLISKKEKENG